MKRIDFIAPVESMRGNLSGNQKLQYPANDNRAYDAPEGVNYARNYRPSFIGAKVAKSGRKYFTVKTKAATKIDAATKLAMAALGGAGSVRGAIKRNASLMASIIANYGVATIAGTAPAKNVMKWMYDVIREGLIAKSTYFDFSVSGGSSIRVKNPWVKSSVSATVITVPTEILVKFWDMLANSPVIFSINGMKGVAHGAAAGESAASADSFSTIIASGYNVLGLSAGATESGFTLVKMGDQFVTFTIDGVEYNAVTERAVLKQSDDSHVTDKYAATGENPANVYTD